MKTLEMKYGRRTLLQSAAAATLTLPFHPRRLRAQEAGKRPLRFVTWFAGCGTSAEDWDPSGTETSFKLNTIQAPLTQFQKKIVVIKGLTSVACQRSKTHPHHKAAGTWLNPTIFTTHSVPNGKGPSLDQVIAEKAFAKLPFRSVQLGVVLNLDFPSPRLAIVHHVTSGGEPLFSQQSPYLAFDRLFAGVVTGKAPPPPAEGLPAADQAQMDYLRIKRRSILDRVKVELGQLETALGAPERQRFQQHLTVLREIEDRLQPGSPNAPLAPVPLTCTKPELKGGVGVGSNDNIPVLTRLQTDVLVAALACDRTRVISLMNQGGQCEMRPRWIGVGRSLHHDISHTPMSNAQARRDMTKIQTWYHEEFAYLLGKMDSLAEGAYTMLDNSLVFYGNELGNAASHSPTNIPITLAGGAAGRLKTGRFLTRQGVSLTNLHRSILEIFGVPDDKFGGDTGTGRLDGLI